MATTFNPCDECGYSNSKQNQDDGMCRICEFKKLLDLGEQGKLKKLPCKIGDMVDVIPGKVNRDINVINGHPELNRVYRQVVSRIEFSEHGYTLITCDGMCRVTEMFYRETWFLKGEEAEAALKELPEELLVQPEGTGGSQ